MEKRKPISMGDIAEAAGVSRMTVSLALRDAARIPPATRQRIREIAERLGYRPDPRVRRAMAAIAQSRHGGRHSDRIVFLTSHTSADGWRQYSHDYQCYAGALERVRSYGYSLETVWALDPKLRGEKLSRMLWAQGIEGILLAPLGPGAWTGVGWKLDLDWDRFSVVELDETMDAPFLHLARHDHFNAGLLLLESMENLGYRRIGLALDRGLDLRTRHRWSAAWIFWRTMRGFDSSLEPFLFDQFDAAIFRRWLSAGKVDAVIGGTEWFYEALLGTGFKIPSDLGVAVLDRSVDYGRIAVSGIHQNAELIGEAAIDLLTGMIHRGERGVPTVPTQRICQGVWIKGRTTKKVGPPLGGPPLLRTMFPAVTQ